jgi:hypothetical protein
LIDPIRQDPLNELIAKAYKKIMHYLLPPLIDASSDQHYLSRRQLQQDSVSIIYRDDVGLMKGNASEKK